MGVYMEKDELYFILTGQSGYYEAHFEMHMEGGGVANVVYMATPGPHIFNYTTLETTWCRPEVVEKIIDATTTVEVSKSYTIEQEVRRRMRLMDKFLIEKCNLKIGERKYTPLAEAKVMINDNINNIMSVVGMTIDLFDLNEHTAREEE